MYLIWMYYDITVNRLYIWIYAYNNHFKSKKSSKNWRDSRTIRALSHFGGNTNCHKHLVWMYIRFGHVHSFSPCCCTIFFGMEPNIYLPKIYAAVFKLPMSSYTAEWAICYPHSKRITDLMTSLALQMNLQIQGHVEKRGNAEISTYHATSLI